MGRVLGIEIGYSLIRICETDLKAKNPKVYKCISMMTPGNVVDDGMLAITDELIEKLKAALKSNHVRTKQVVFSIASTKIAAREILIPEVKENKIQDLIETNAPDYFPMDISQYRLSYSIMDTIEAENGSRKLKIQLLATPIQMVERYKELAVKCGLQAIAVDYNGNSIFQMMKAHDTKGIQMTIKADERMAFLIIMKNEKVILQRTVAYGVDEAIEAFTEKNNMYSYTDAMDIFGREEYIGSSLEEDSIRDTDELKKNITESLSYLVRGIGRVLDYYNSKNPEEAVTEIYVTGIGGEFKNFDKLLTHELGIRTIVLTGTEGTSVAKAFAAGDKKFGLYMACIGAAAAPLWSVTADKKKKTAAAAGKNAGRDLDKIAIIALCLGALAAIGMTAYSITAQIIYSSQRDELNAKVEELRPAENIYNKYNYSLQQFNDAQIIETSSENNNGGLKDFIEEMERRLPSDITVLSLVATADIVTMNITVQSKASAAQTVAELRKFDSISAVETIGLTDSINETGVHEINFTVNCTYNTAQTEGGEGE